MKKYPANKIVFSFFSVVAFLGLSTSCDSSESDPDYSYLTDARITAFNLPTNDSITKNLASYYFTIDQNNDFSTDALGQIYNNDSLPYGTNLKRALINFTTNYALKAQVVYDDEDPADFTMSTDSIDFTKSKVLLKVIAGDGVNSKLYQLKVNVHRQDPDSMEWKKVTPTHAIPARRVVALYDSSSDHKYCYSLNGNSLEWFDLEGSMAMNQSTFGATPRLESIVQTSDAVFMLDANNTLWKQSGWGALFVTTSMTVNRLLGYVQTIDSKDYLIAVVTTPQGERVAAIRTNDYHTILSTSPISPLFPTADNFARVNNHATDAPYRSLTLVGGAARDQKYSTSFQFHILNETLYASGDLNGNPMESNQIPFLVNPSVVVYDSKFYVMGGFNEIEQEPSTSLAISPDFGRSWSPQTKKQVMPDDFNGRSEASAIVDKNNNIWLIGGRLVNGAYTTEVWKGKLNRLGHAFVKK